MKSYQFKYIFSDEEDLDLELDWTEDINYPFLSPLNIIFYSGKPVGKIAYLTLTYQSVEYAFGTINYSKGEKFIFFFGLKDPRIYDTLSKKRGILSHITLDRDKKNFHIKFQDDQTRAPKFRTTEFENDHYYWFSIALGHPNSLRPLKNLKYDFRTPKSDGTRRINEISYSFDKISHKILTIPENTLFDDEFLNFDFYISTQAVLNNQNIKIIPPTTVLPRTRKGKIYSVDLIETDFKLGICITRMRPRVVLESNLARIYHHDIPKNLL